MAVRNAAALVATLIALGLIAGIAFAAVAVLPEPSHGDRLAIRVLDVLRRHEGYGSVLSISGSTFHVTCVPLQGKRQLVTIGDGGTMILRGSHVLERHKPSTPLADIHLNPGAVTSAEADLAGSYALYAVEIVAQLEQGAKFDVTPTGQGSERTIALVLHDARPRVELIVAERSLRPVAARYRSRRLHAEARLLSATGVQAGC